MLSMDGMSVIRITEPSFELRPLTDGEVEGLPCPQTVVEIEKGQLFGVVKWLGDPSGHKSNELDRFATRAAEYLIERWNEAPAD